MRGYSRIATFPSLATEMRTVSGGSQQGTVGGLYDPQTLLDCLPGMAYQRRNDRDWQMQYVSAGATALCGCSPDALLGGRASWGKLIHPDDRESVWQSVQDALRHGIRFEVRYRIVTQDKRYKWVWERGCSIDSDDPGQLIEGFITDITLLRQREIELERSNAFSTAIVDSAAEGIVLVDAEFRIESFNRAAETMFSVKTSMVVGKYLDHLFSSWDYGLLKNHFREFSRSGRSPLFSDGLELTGRRANGSTFPLHLNIRQLTFEGGRSYTALIRDISKQNASEERIQRQHERLNATIEFSPVGISMLDVELRIIAVNRAFARILGYSEEEIIGRHFADFYHPAEVDDAEHAMRAILAGGSSHYLTQRRYVHKDGHLVPAAISVAVGHDSAGNPDFLVVNVDDQTERQEAEAQIQKQQAQIIRLDRLSVLGEMMAGVAHEINQPLTAISTYAQASLRFLDPKNPKPDRLKEAFTKLSEQARRAGDIVERIRELARQGESVKELVNANDLLRKVEQLAIADARARGALIRLDLQESLQRVWCDPVQIQQAILNLVRNAVDAIVTSDFKHGNEIVLRTSTTEHNAVRIEVTDSGNGVSSAASATMFRPFLTAKHTGLGLSITRAIVKAHGGDLDYNNNPKAGATFFLTLPPAVGDS